MNEIVFAVLISILVFLLIFILSILSRRKVKPKETPPYSSGERMESLEVQYALTWIYYASIFVIFESFFLPLVFSSNTSNLLSVLIYSLIFLLIAISLPRIGR